MSCITRKYLEKLRNDDNFLHKPGMKVRKPRQTNRGYLSLSRMQLTTKCGNYHSARMCMRVTVLTPCVCVCEYVSFSGSIKRLYRISNMAIGFTLDLKDFQLTDFVEKASFMSYSSFTTFRPFEETKN